MRVGRGRVSRMERGYRRSKVGWVDGRRSSKTIVELVNIIIISVV